MEDNMAKTAADLSENPGLTEELVRDIEDSGYPVDGSREQFIRQPDGLAAAATSEPGAAPALDSAQRIRAIPTEDDGNLPKQRNAANSGKVR